MSLARRGLDSRQRRDRVPSCKGPKLGRFQDHHLSIEFVRLLSDPATAAHSYVFEVRIGGKSYALKIFRYYDLEEDEPGLSDSELDDPDLLSHIDPFFAECRAFGRIIDEGENGKLAVKCFGYLYVPADREIELEERFEATDWDRPEAEYNYSSSARQPLRAIVKSLVTAETDWNARTSKRVLRNLKSLHALGVYMFDVREENIVGGEFVDFSISWTKPHVLLRKRAGDRGMTPRERDLLMFDGMMETLRIRNAPRALPNAEYCRKLRSVKSGNA